MLHNLPVPSLSVTRLIIIKIFMLSAMAIVDRPITGNWLVLQPPYQNYGRQSGKNAGWGRGDYE